MFQVSSVPFTGTAGTRYERTFLALKPDAVQRGLMGDIIKRFEDKGFKIVGMKLLQATREQAEAHYEEHKGKGFFKGLVDFFVSGPILAFVVEGENVIESARAMMGATKPKDSAPGTIRGMYAVNMGRNVIHGSDSAASATREISHWFKADEVVAWEKSDVNWRYE